MHTDQRRLAGASPHDKLWGIGLSACDYRASFLDTWRGSNLLGQVLEHVREILCRKTMPQISDSIPPDTTAPMDNSSDTVFEVDPVIHIRLDAASSTAHTYKTILSTFIDSVLNDYAPEVLLAHTIRADEPLMPEQGPDLTSGVVTMDSVTFTALLSLTSGASATSRFHCCALPDTESPQPFIHQGAFDQMVALGAADESYALSTTPRSWSGFGSRELLRTIRQVRITIQFYCDGTPSASLAVWTYIVPNATVWYPLLVDQDSWMRFYSHSYQTRAPTRWLPFR